MTSTTSAIEEAALRLIDAARSRIPCDPVRDLIDHDVSAAYAVQSRVVANRLATGAVVIGRKIGLTSTAVQAQLGVGQPDFGVLFADTQYESGAEVPVGRLMQPKVEAEIAFVLGQDLVHGPLDRRQMRRSVSHAVAALEIVDSRIAGWDIGYADTIADNASSGLFALGTKTVGLDDFEPATSQMTMKVDGGEVVSTGSGVDCLGDPLEALAWLARTACELGEPLRAGQIVLSGALGPMAVVSAGATVEAHITGLGAVSVTFTGGEDR